MEVSNLERKLIKKLDNLKFGQLRNLTVMHLTTYFKEFTLKQMASKLQH